MRGWMEADYRADLRPRRVAPWAAVSTFVLLLSVSLPAHAYINTGRSVEWLCEFSPVVVHARVRSVTDHEKTRDVPFESAQVECEPIEFLKGKAGERIRFKFAGYGTPGREGTKYLLFLAGDKGAAVTYWINLDNPCTELSGGVAYTKNGEVLKEGAGILKLAQERVKGKARPNWQAGGYRGVPESLYIEAPGESAQALWAGSSTFLYVPPDPEFKNVLTQRYRGGLMRRERWEDDIRTGISLLALSYYPDKDVIQLLKHALSDGHYRQFKLREDPKSGFPGEVIRLYVLRQVAYEALTAMGQKVAKPEHFCEFFQLEVRGALGHGWWFRDPKTQRALHFEAVK